MLSALYGVSYHTCTHVIIINIVYFSGRREVLIVRYKRISSFCYLLTICIVELRGQLELQYGVHGVQYWETIVKIRLARDCKFTGNCDHRSLTKFTT